MKTTEELKQFIDIEKGTLLPTQNSDTWIKFRSLFGYDDIMAMSEELIMLREGIIQYCHFQCGLKEENIEHCHDCKLKGAST